MIVALIIPAVHAQKKKTSKKRSTKPTNVGILCGKSMLAYWWVIVILLFGQDLLQLQYEGVAVMKMFGRAKINVNLLIFLLNKKFYGK